MPAPSLKIAEPATSTSAPAATASGADAASIPPSTSRPQPGFNLFKGLFKNTPSVNYQVKGAEPLPGGSAALSNVVLADGVIRIDAARAGLPEGTAVDVLMFD